jgi:hypothetical protein
MVINHEGEAVPYLRQGQPERGYGSHTLDTLPALSVDGVNKVYQQLKDILCTTTMQQAEGSLKC